MFNPATGLNETVVADAEAMRAANEKRARVYAAEQRKFADEKKGIGAKLSEYDQLKRVQAQAKLNPAAYLESLYGKDWYDRIVETKLNGGAPTADTVALEVEKVREEFSKKFEEHKSEQTKAQAEAQQQRIQSELRAFSNQAVEFAKSNLKEYPIFERLGGEEQVGATLVQRIRTEHDRTIQREPETGAVLKAGKVLSLKEAADAVEADLIAIAETAFGHDKYRPKLTEKLKPATVAVSGGPQLRRTEVVERRTLSNDLTATTPGRQPATTDEERRQRAIAAFNAVRAKAPA